MAFHITLKTDNAAFEESRSSEVARILRTVADAIDRGADYGPCMDANGNKVGAWQLR